MSPKLLLIDTHSLFHRAYHAIPYLSGPDGQPTHAAYGFTGTLLRLLKEEAPDAAALACDTPQPTFRHREFAAYKAQRPPTPDDLVAQFPILREIAAAFDLPLFELAGYEADDVLGSLAVRGAAAGYQVILVTGDHDLLQLVTDRVHVLAARQGITVMERFDPAAVEARYGVRPEQLADLKGLTGDPSDNIPGVPGIGEKTAVQLLHQFGTLEHLLQCVSEVRNPRVRQALASAAEQARWSVRLGTLRTDLPLEFDWAELHRPPLDFPRVQEVFRKYQFTSLFRRLETLKVQQRTLF